MENLTGTEKQIQFATSIINNMNNNAVDFFSNLDLKIEKQTKKTLQSDAKKTSIKRLQKLVDSKNESEFYFNEITNIVNNCDSSTKIINAQVSFEKVAKSSSISRRQYINIGFDLTGQRDGYVEY